MVTTEGVSCITTQTNSKGVFLCFNVEKQMRDYEESNPRMIRKFTQEKPANICMRDLQNTRVVHDAQVAHKESHAYTKKCIFKVFLDIFRLWCLLESLS